ncbi:hypothetical protein ABZV31_29040 [Streptomyces sp. NPDC005202]|uniref:hypothetical protein n=1 Tax=Streptomyces sp. NPDC005202 TaxID=3157021 RepID=UPI0033AAC791
MLCINTYAPEYVEAARRRIDEQVAAYRAVAAAATGLTGRLLSASLTGNDGRLLADQQIRLKPETSVLGYAVGDEIRVLEQYFQRLAKAFFAGIEAKFV